MNINTIDLNLLVVFDALMRTRSVTLAGEKLGLSQSATSNSLQRLRDALGDPVFVRTYKGMEPSPLALELERPIRDTLDQLRETLQRTRVFDPATASRRFKILQTDIAQQVHMPRLVAKLRAQAPNISLEVVTQSLREAKQAMIEGEIDLAIGFLPEIGPDFHRKYLFSEAWVGVLSAHHPTVGPTLSEDEYMSALHIAYSPSTSIHFTLEKLLTSHFSSKGIKRKIGLSVPYWSGLAATIEASDLILTAPLGPALSMTRIAKVRVVSLPFDLPSIDLHMQWHDRVHADAANQWFRNLCAETFIADTQHIA